MSSDDDDEELQSGSSTKELQFIATQVFRHPEVLKKSQVPSVKKNKDAAIDEIVHLYKKTFGKDLDKQKFMKKVNNMKTRLKNKTNRKKTGNKPIKMNEWEKVLYEALDGEENPTIGKIPGAKSCGVTAVSFSQEEDLRRSSTVNVDVFHPQAAISNSPDLIPPPPPPKKVKTTLGSETAETRTLTTGELQRLVLLEQLQTTRVQREYYQLKIKKLMDANPPESEKSYTYL